MNLWTGSGNTREFGIWLYSNTSTPLYTGTIDKTSAEVKDNYYVFKLPTDITIVKNTKYIYGAFGTNDSRYFIDSLNTPYYGVFTVLFAYDESTELKCPSIIQDAVHYVLESSFSYNGVINVGE